MEEHDEETTSEEYEAHALQALVDEKVGVAAVYAQLALVATVREAAYVLAEIIDPGLDEEGESEEEVETE